MMDTHPVVHSSHMIDESMVLAQETQEEDRTWTQQEDAGGKVAKFGKFSPLFHLSSLRHFWQKVPPTITSNTFLTLSHFEATLHSRSVFTKPYIIAWFRCNLPSH